MKKEQILKMHEAMNAASGEDKAPPTDEQINVLIALDQDEMDAFKSGKRFYASDMCAYCDNYSGYGQVWCGECEAGRSDFGA